MTTRSKQWYTRVSRSPKRRVTSSIGLYSTQVEEISGPENDQTRAGQATHRWQLPPRRQKHENRCQPPFRVVAKEVPELAEEPARSAFRHAGKPWQVA